MKTIQGKILLVVVSTLIILTALITSIAVTVTHEIMNRDADRILNSVSQKEAAEINEMLNDFVKSAQIIKHYTVNEMEDTEALKDEAYLNEYLENVRHLFDEVAINTSGTYSYYLFLSPAQTSVPVGFYSKFEADGSVHQLSESEFSSLSIMTEKELMEYSHFTGSTSGEWVAPHSSRFTGETVISYMLPIYSDNTFLGLLGFNMEFDYLLDRVNSISVYEYGHALLIGPDKQVCYNLPENTEFLDEYTEAVTPLVNGMSLELRAAYKDIQSNIYPMLTYIILAFLTVFVLAVIFTFLVTRKIVEPLKKLISAASNITSGEQNVDLIVDSDDEIGALSRVLSDTYSKIQEYSTYVNTLAYRDSLTGIKNRTAYTEAIEEINKEINLGNSAFGVIVADMNYLKKTNDTYGHDVGNELLIHASKILTDTFQTSSIFRIGGDEFVVILKGIDFEKYRVLIEKMNTAFSDDYITVFNNNKIPVSVARGVSIFDPSIDHVYSDVFEKADHAMYLNKIDMKAER